MGYGFASGLAQRGHDVSVLRTSRAHSEWRIESGYMVRGMLGAQQRWIKMAPIALAIRSAIKSEQPDIIFSSAYRPTGFPATYWAKRLRIPVVFYAHGSEFLTEKDNALRLRLLRWACSNTAALVANSQNTANLVQEILSPTPIPPISVIHPGIDISRFPVLPEPEGPPVILTLSNATHRKGGDLVIQAVAQLRKSGFPNLKLIVGGDGPYLKDLKSLAINLGISDSVEWLGSVPQEKVPELMSRCTLFVLASRPVPTDLESFGIVYIEAGAVGRAVIGTRVGGIPEAILDNQTGLIVQPEDPVALADAIAELLRNPEHRKAWSNQDATGRRN